MSKWGKPWWRAFPPYAPFTTRNEYVMLLTMTKKSAKPAAKKPAAKAAPKKAAAEGSNKVAKTQLVEMVADKTGLTKKQSEEAVSTMLDCIVGAIKGGQSVGLPGLGTLSVKATAARTGVRPGTSEKIQIPAGKKVAFKVASTLKGNL
ncbi:DNA-binding protein [Deinococcus cavernae]|uniref:DNA-binding protein n=2 Tax=Deinococcaceae TaxID=183710 RepID=A0A418UZS6_9DEIO|nr:DNA-binding protein [Deinococcus cavernae]